MQAFLAERTAQSKAQSRESSTAYTEPSKFSVAGPQKTKPGVDLGEAGM